GLEFATDEPVEPLQPDGHRDSIPGERAADEPAVGSVEHPRYVRRVADARVTTVEFLADVEEFDLPTGLVAYDIVDVVEALDTLELDARALGDRDVDVLADRAEPALYLSCGAQQHTDALGGLLGLCRRAD